MSSTLRKPDTTALRRCARLPVPYTHRVAIANSRLIAFDGERMTFKWKDYRAKLDPRYKLMTFEADEFIRRFLIQVLPDGFHRIRHYGLFANGGRREHRASASAAQRTGAAECAQ
jgi:hypothetical protein